jgi:hypothetical protein
VECPDGALTQVYLAASPDLRESGKYHHPVAHKQDPNPLALGKQGEELGDALFAFVVSCSVSAASEHDL